MKQASKCLPLSAKRCANRQRGVTLIELMVSLVIGLVLTIVASSIYLYAKQAYSAVSENSQLEENGRFALNLLARNVQSAGFVMLDPKSSFPPGATDIKIRGCDFGMVNPTLATSNADIACLASTPTGSSRSASFGVFYDTDAYTTAGSKYQGFDCLGNAAVVVPSITGGSPTNQVRNYFFVSTAITQTAYGSTTMGQLSCLTDPRTSGATTGTFQMQPLIPGIEQLAVTYLTPSGLNKNSAQKVNTATALEASNNWSQVTAVELCVLAKSIQTTGNDTGTQVTDCYGNAFTPPNGQTYRRFTTTVNMRNRTPS